MKAAATQMVAQKGSTILSVTRLVQLMGTHLGLVTRREKMMEVEMVPRWVNQMGPPTASTIEMVTLKAAWTPKGAYLATRKVARKVGQKQMVPCSATRTAGETVSSSVEMTVPLKACRLLLESQMDLSMDSNFSMEKLTAAAMVKSTA